MPPDQPQQPPSAMRLATLQSAPGIRRDGTKFASKAYVDGQWVRFNQRSLPQKIGGYRQITDQFAGPSYGCELVTRNGINYFTSGSANVIQQVQFDQFGYGAGIYDRTPSGFAASPNNIYSMDSMYDATDNDSQVLVHGAPNLLDLTSSTQTPVYIGDNYGTAALTSAGISVSGGVCVLWPFAVAYDNDGLVNWSDANMPTSWTPGTGSQAGNARIASSKIIKGTPLRGGADNAPSGLFWSLDSLHVLSYQGGTVFFSSDFVGATQLLGQNAPVEYNGIYFWPTATRQFMTYNGTLQVVQNLMNVDDFFNNLNWQYRNLVWGFANYIQNEIWWLYPRGTATYCTNAVIYNLALNTWYDTEISRSSGIFGTSFRWPVMFDTQPTAEGTYPLWQHEYNYDQYIGNIVTAIPAYIETADLTLIADGMQGIDQNIYIDYVEPDFVQNGDVTLTVNTQKFSNSPVVPFGPYTFDDTTQYINPRCQGRQLRFRFDSNTAGGFFELGKTTVRWKSGDKRP